jgi:hypothetical protein
VQQELMDSPAKGIVASMHSNRSWKLLALRFLIVAAGLIAWFGTQSLIQARHAAAGTLPVESDALLTWLSPAHDYLAQHIAARNALLISSSTVINLLAILIFIRAIFGPTLRPFLGLLIVFGLRQVFQAVCVLPAPPGIIWTDPGFPGLLVTYSVANDFFFSGHTALAVFGAVELARIHRGLIPVGIAIALFEAGSVLALRAHWTMDVYAGAVTAIMVACMAGPIARPVDRWLGMLSGRRR